MIDNAETNGSESESLEDEVGSGLSLASTLGVSVSVLELGFEGLEHGLALLGVLESLLGDGLGVVEVLLDGESGGEQVSVVDILDKRLDARLAVNLLLGHPLSHLLGGALDTGNESVTELSALFALIDRLNDYCLLARASSGGENDDASLLHTNIERMQGKQSDVCHQTRSLLASGEQNCQLAARL